MAREHFQDIGVGCLEPGELGFTSATPFCNGNHLFIAVWSSGMHYLLFSQYLLAFFFFLLTESHIYIDQQYFELTVRIVITSLVAEEGREEGGMQHSSG